MSFNHTKSIEDVGSWTFEIESGLFCLDQRCASFFQLEQSQIQYCDFLNLFNVENYSFLDSHFQQLIQTKNPFVLECAIGNRESEKLVRFSGAPAELSEGKVVKLAGIIRLCTNDINSEFRQEQIYNILDDFAIISIANVRGEIIYANKLFCEVSGYELPELIGKTHSLVKSGIHSREFYKDMWNTISQGQAWHGEIVNKKKNGELYYVDARIYPVINYKHEITEFISVRFDITEKKKREQEELVRAKFQMMGETSAQIMHDVMNPLTIIQMSLEVLDLKLKKDLTISPENLENYVAKMKDSSQRIKNIFSNMKDLLHSKQEVASMDLFDCVHKTLEISSLRLGKYQVESELRFRPGRYVVDFNFQQLLQVLINLVNNSIDATETLPEKWIRFEVSEQEDYLVLSVIDSGQGIDPSLRSKVFQSLFTTKDRDKGTGLGLSICKRIVENYGGKILINGQSSNTQFDIYLKKKVSVQKAA